MIKVKLLSDIAVLPTKAHDTDLGYDLYSSENIVLYPGSVTLVSTGIACKFPDGYGALIRDRSGFSTKNGIFVIAGVIDENYTGEIKIAFYNPSHQKYSNNFTTEISMRQNHQKFISPGDKVAQMILIPTTNFPIVEVRSLDVTDRGSDGFGSSGNN